MICSSFRALPGRGALYVASLLAATVLGCGGDAPTAPRGPAVARVRVTPSTVYLTPGSSWQVSAVALDDTGATLAGARISFTSTNASVAAVTSDGVIRAGNSGTATIHAQSGTAHLDVPVVVAPDAPGGFSIDVRSYGHVNQTVMSAALAAAARWSQVINTALVAYPVVGTEADSGICGPGVPAVHETVQNLVVLITTDSIDGRGSVAAQAGPCIYRNDPPQLTVVGTIEVDSADVADAQSEGVLADLVTHEMGHVLGIGSLWFPEFNSVPASSTTSGLGTSDPRFIGVMARGASAELGFTSDSSLGVPIENQGKADDGTRDAHWRASVFGDELMTGTLHQSNPLSLVTIRALQDMGYSVNPTAADHISVATAGGTGTLSSQRNAAARGSGYEIHERVLGPRFRVTRDGRLHRVAPRGRAGTATAQ